MQGLVSSNAGAPSTSANNFAFAQNTGGLWGASEVPKENVVPLNGTFDYFRVHIGSAPTSGTSYQFIFRQNSSSTLLKCTIVATSSSCVDTSDIITVSTGDLIDIESVPSGTPPTATVVQWALRFTSNNTNEYPVLYGDSLATTSSATRYLGVQGDELSGGQTTPNLRESIIPTNGTLSNLYVMVAANEVTAATITLDKNGVDTALTCTVSAGAATTCSDTNDSVNVVAGDSVTYKITSGSTGQTIGIGAKFSPTVDGESIFLRGNASVAQNTTTFVIPEGTSGANTAENLRQGLLIAGTLKKLYVGANPASGQTTTFTESVNASVTALKVIVTGTALSGNDTSDLISVNDDDLLSLKLSNSSLSGTTADRAGVVFYIAPPSGNTVIPERTLTGVGL